VDKLGYAITLPTELTASSRPTTVERMKRYEVAAFIRNARSVCGDPVVEQNMLNDLLAHAHGAANKFLESYFHADDFAKNPFQIMKHQTVSVQLESILQASPKSYEVRWSETARDMSGAPLGTSHWKQSWKPRFSAELDGYRHQQSTWLLCHAAQLGGTAELKEHPDAVRCHRD
jgi:type IV secretory pathway TrbF-like protein